MAHVCGALVANQALRLHLACAVSYVSLTSITLVAQGRKRVQRLQNLPNITQLVLII